MGKRLGALLVALLLIVGAVVVRDLLDSGGDVTIGRTASPVVCDPLVIAACRQAFEDRTVSEEIPGDTLDRLLAERDPEPFLWVTADVWLEILETETARLSRPDPIAGVEGPLAQSDLHLVAPVDRQACDELSWSCLAADAASEESDLDIGLDTMDTTMGLLSWGDLVAGFFGRSDFSRNDFDTGDFPIWWNRIGARAVEPKGRSAFEDLVVRQGLLDVAPALELEWLSLVRPGFEARVPPDATRRISIVAASVGAEVRGAGDLPDRLSDAGWSGGGTLPEGDPASTPAPVAAGVLQALRSYRS